MDKLLALDERLTRQPEKVMGMLIQLQKMRLATPLKQIPSRQTWLSEAAIRIALWEQRLGWSGTPLTKQGHMGKKWWKGQDSNLCTLCGQIYSLLPLTTRPPLHGEHQLSGNCLAVRQRLWRALERAA